MIRASVHLTPPQLTYINEPVPGFRRRKCGRGFIYLDPRGRRVTDTNMLARFKALVIPPAWTEVWICPDPEGHVQATGRDQRRRKQYIYHPGWHDLRSATKFDQLAAFAQKLPRLRQAVQKDLRGPKLNKRKVTAIVVGLLEETGIRVGNRQYAEQNGTFGLTTLRQEHLEITGRRIHLFFPGKSHKQWDVTLQDARLARLLHACEGLPGQELFTYPDGSGCYTCVTSTDVNAYVQECMGEQFSAKHFRTWEATVEAYRRLSALAPASSKTAADRVIRQVVKDVAGHLNHTPAICRTYYIHPAIPEAYRDQTLFRRNGRRGTRPGLNADETATLRILQRGQTPLSPHLTCRGGS